MSTERDKTHLMKKKIKALESQIDQKNSILTSIKQTEVSNEERIKYLKAQNDAKLKNLNVSISRLRQENTVFKSTKSPASPNKYYFPPISKRHSRNVSADPRLQKSETIESPMPILDELKEDVGTNNDNNNNENGNVNNNNNNNGMLNVSTLTKQLELLKKENERLRLKNRQINEKIHTEVAGKEKELLELRKLKKELGGLKEKFDILSRKNKPKDNQNQSHNENIESKTQQKGIKEDTLMFLNRRIQELQKAVEGKFQENEKVKDEINKYKVKAHYLIAEKKQNLEAKEKNDQECQCEPNVKEEVVNNCQCEANEFEEVKEQDTETFQVNQKNGTEDIMNNQTIEMADDPQNQKIGTENQQIDEKNENELEQKMDTEVILKNQEINKEDMPECRKIEEMGAEEKLDYTFFYY